MDEVVDWKEPGMNVSGKYRTTGEAQRETLCDFDEKDFRFRVKNIVESVRQIHSYLIT